MLVSVCLRVQRAHGRQSCWVLSRSVVAQTWVIVVVCKNRKLGAEAVSAWPCSGGEVPAPVQKLPFFSESGASVRQICPDVSYSQRLQAAFTSSQMLTLASKAELEVLDDG